MAFEGVVRAFAHIHEHAVQALESVLLVGLDPCDEHVLAVKVLLDAHSLEHRVESLLRVALNDKLLVLHKFGQALKNLKVIEALTERL